MIDIPVRLATELTGDAHTNIRILAKPTVALPRGNIIRGPATWTCPNYSVSGEEARVSP